MVVEEEELGEDRGMEQVIIPESTATGKRLWNWAQREGKQLPLYGWIGRPLAGHGSGHKRC